jgi:NADPH:quinone reductase
MNKIVTREEFEHYTGDLFKIMQAGDLKICIHKIYDRKDGAQAYEDLEARRTTGKLLLKM